MKPKAIELHIDTLMLDGIEANRRGVALAAERELTRLFAAQGLPEAFMQSDTQPVMRGAAVSLDARPSAHAIGTAVAKAVHGAKR